MIFIHDTKKTVSIINWQVSAWGGYVFIINLIPLHVFALLLMGRYSERIYTAYNTFFILGLILSMQIPFVGFQPVRYDNKIFIMKEIIHFMKLQLYFLQNK